jgi:hypothetical protein
LIPVDAVGLGHQLLGGQVARFHERLVLRDVDACGGEPRIPLIYVSRRTSCDEDAYSAEHCCSKAFA